jgi:hypothetical protein
MNRPVQLTPGKWYLLLMCPHCRREYIVSDPNNGKLLDDGAKSSSTLCAHCQSPMYHNSPAAARYQHPITTA